MIATLFEHLRDWVFISSYYSHLINYSELLLSLCLLVLSVYGLFHQFKGLQIIWFSLLFLAYYLWGNIITQWSPKICSPRYPGRYLYLCCTWTSGNYIVSKCKLQFSCQNYIFSSLFEEKSFDESDPDPDPDVK